MRKKGLGWIGTPLLLTKRKDYDVIFVVELLSKVSILQIISRFCFSKKFGCVFELLLTIGETPKMFFFSSLKLKEKQE